jgi:hypothetical protein
MSRKQPANDINCRIPFCPARRLSPFASLAGKGKIGIVVVENLMGQDVLPVDPLRRLGLLWTQVV